jgi:hypothetical protein
MWLNIKWYNLANTLLREDGKYGPIDVKIYNNNTQVNSIMDLDDPNTKIYEAHYAMTHEWAQQLLDLGYSPDLPLSFDRQTGIVAYTLGNLANQDSGTYHKTFHFVLNNTVVKDNRIPTYGMSYEEARKRNALPVPANQYGDPSVGGTYNYWDEFELNPPEGAVYADIKLLYQPTSWEYVQFLYLANDGNNPFLAKEGVNLLSAWLNTGMAEPYVMASATWGNAPKPICQTPGTPQTLLANAGKKSITLNWSHGTPEPKGGYRIYYLQSGKLQFRSGVGPAVTTFKDSGLTSRVNYTYVITSWNDCNGNDVFDVGIDTESAISNQASATAQ